MNRRLALAVSLTAIVAGAFLALAPAGAVPAPRIVDSGWWWRLQSGAVTQLPPPPNVEEGMLQVQATPDRAQAIAAVSAELPDGQTGPVLTLRVAEGGDQGGAAAVLLACNAGSGWTGEDAGRWDSAPVVDCSTSVNGVRSDDGATWTFALGSLQFEDRFNIVITPGHIEGAPEGFDRSSFTLVFEEPTAADVTTVSGGSPTADPPPIDLPGTGTPPPAAEPVPGSPAEPGFTAPGPGGGFEAAAPAVGAQPSLEPEMQGSTATAPERQASTEPVVAAVPLGEPRTLARIAGVAVVLAGLAGAFATWRTDGSTGLLGAAAATEEHPVTGGLGRFARVRTSEPNTLA